MRPDYATANAHFARLDPGHAPREDAIYSTGRIENCDVCSRPMAAETYMIDGSISLRENAYWGNLCVLCAYRTCPKLGVGLGQLFRQVEGRWCLVAGDYADDEPFDL
jgi:hypothetical protein